MKKILLLFALLGLCVNINAQSKVRYKNHNLIFNSEIASGNPYTAAASGILTGLVNYYLLNDAFFENSFAYSLYSTDDDNLNVRTMNPMGLTAKELFNNLQAGVKLGWQTYNPEFWNGGFYASAHYKLEQFEAGFDNDNMQTHRAQRALFGVTGLLTLGDMGKSSRVTIEVGVRYSMALAYKSPMGNGKDLLADGFVSHYAIKLLNRGMWQNIGVYADINHFNMWKNYDNGKKLNNYTFGITWTITPQQVEDIKDWSL